MSGLAVTILIDKRIKSLFAKTGNLDPADVHIAGKRFRHWKAGSLERMLRAAALVAVFVAGLSAPMQDVIWVSDEDSIAPNVPKLADLTHVFAHYLGNMLCHNVGHIRVGTTGTTAGDDLLMEDYVAISDLCAGAVNDFITAYLDSGIPLGPVISLAPSTVPRKAFSLVADLFDERAPLRKLAFSIESDPTGRIHFRRLRLHLQPFVTTE